MTLWDPTWLFGTRCDSLGPAVNQDRPLYAKADTCSCLLRRCWVNSLLTFPAFSNVTAAITEMYICYGSWPFPLTSLLWLWLSCKTHPAGRRTSGGIQNKYLRETWRYYLTRGGIVLDAVLPLSPVTSVAFTTWGEKKKKERNGLDTLEGCLISCFQKIYKIGVGPVEVNIFLICISATSTCTCLNKERFWTSTSWFVI